jgi:exonuclease III
MGHAHYSKNREWKILCWHMRGLNSQIKWTSIRSKILESSCDIICLQETKRKIFNHAYLKNFFLLNLIALNTPHPLAHQGGTIVTWKSSRFLGQVVFQNVFAMSMEFVYVFSGASWILMNVYVPCTLVERQLFLQWFHNYDMPEEND